MTIHGATAPRASGIYGDWVLVAIGIAIAALGFAYRGSPPGAGSVIKAEFTLVPVDADQLACASNRQFETLHCAYVADGKSAPLTDRPVVPAVTVARELFFVAGLFQDPTLAEYVRTHRNKPQERFTATCQIRLVEHVDDMLVRFRGPAFTPAEPGWVADVQSCRVPPPPR
jgi:hypothetical protein